MAVYPRLHPAISQVLKFLICEELMGKTELYAAYIIEPFSLFFAKLDIHAAEIILELRCGPRTYNRNH